MSLTVECHSPLFVDIFAKDKRVPGIHLFFVFLNISPLGCLVGH